MVVGSLTVETDVVVIGAGPGGYIAAIRAAQFGLDVMVIDKDARPGGICLNHGCIPTKAMIHASHFVDEMRSMEHIGVHVKDYTVDFDQMHEWKEGILEKLGKGISGLFEKYGIEYLQGTAHFVGEHEVRVEGKSDVNAVKFKHAVIATGSLPIEIPGFPFSDDYVWSSRKALEVAKIPKKLVIIGGGYIGTEMGTVYGKLGSHVDIIEAQDMLIPQLDQELVRVVAKKLKDFNIETHFNCKAKAIDKEKKQVIVEKEEKDIRFDADQVLVVVGRRPNTNKIGLQELGVDLDQRGFIKVNEKMQTSITHIYAIGDVTAGPMLAHKAARQGKIAAEVIGGEPSAYDIRSLPAVVFNDPELCSVGLTKEQAEEQGKQVIVGKFPFAALGRAMTVDKSEGFCKVIAEKDTHLVLGVHAVGPHVSDIVSEAALAIEMGATLEDIALTIHPHPTMSEGIMEACENALGWGVHTFQKKKKE